MLESYLAIFLGLVLLAFGADRFIDGASAIATNCGVSPLLVGLTVVGFATSAPELLVAAVAAVNGSPAVAVGNAIGSNIANIGLVIGVTAVVAPLAVHSRVLRREFPIMLAAMLFALLTCWDGLLGLIDGAALAVALLLVIAFTTYLGVTESRQDPLIAEIEQQASRKMSTWSALLWLLIGLGTLLAGSQALVQGAVSVATHFGISDLVIGLTVVAIGTSLPELAASVASALKGEPDIALGNVIGSNMFNALGVMAVPGLLKPTTLDAEVLSRDFPVMLGLSVVLFVVAVGWRGDGNITRVEGIALLFAFVAYQCLLYLTS